MAIEPGTHLGPYEILSALGAGGMGEVYRARDTRLHRVVAIKVLPANRSSDSDARRRFDREARAIASLNHPNICTVFDVSHEGDHDFLVMELLEGETLHERLSRGAFELAALLDSGIALADALDSAHGRGLIHRDLKPANIFLTTRGQLKILDFGLAKMVPVTDGTTFEESGLTGPAAVVGTTAYMSPEQLRAEPLDVRTDLFSLGLVLYEMATGHRAFTGRTSAIVSAAILGQEPAAPHALRADLPIHLEEAILKLLEKDRLLRCQSAAELRADLSRVKRQMQSDAARTRSPVASGGPLGTASGSAPGPGPNMAPASSGTHGVTDLIDPDRIQETDTPPVGAGGNHRPRTAWWTLVAVLVALTAAAFAWKLAVSRPDGTEEHSAMGVVPLSTLSGLSYWPTLSPDGAQVAFSRSPESEPTSAIYVQAVGSAEARQLTGGTPDAWGPSWSPEGGRIAFLRRASVGGRIHVTSPIGDSDLKVSDFAAWAPISWSSDGKDVAVRHAVAAETEESGIWLVPLDGASPRPITHPKPPAYDSAPAFSPDGRELAYVSCTGQLTGGCHVYVVALSADLMPSASPVRLTAKTFYGIVAVAWSRDGRSLVFDGENLAISQLLRVPANGSRPPVPIEIAGLGAGPPATARNSDILAFPRTNRNTDIYSFELDQPARAVITSSVDDIQPELSSNNRLAFCSDRSGHGVEVWVAAADGSGAHQLTHGPNRWQCSPHWSPDAGSIVFDSQADDGHWHLWTIDSDGGTPRQLTQDPGSQNIPSWSGDGKWIYFTGDGDTGRNVFRVTARGGSPEPLTHTGGSYPRESADRLSLLYKLLENVNSPLLSMSLADGATKELVGCVRSSVFAVSRRGIYYVACEPGPSPPLHLLDPATGLDRLVATLERLAVVPGLGVSPDGSTIFYTRFVTNSRDLMLIENFK